MKIAVDVMGGDKGPDIIVRGALEAARTDPDDLGIVLVGDESLITQELARQRDVPSTVEVRHASDVVGMSEAPAAAIRKKKDSSIAVCMRLHKERLVDAIVSAGNTGATVAGALVTLGRLHGVSRPAIMTYYPTRKEWVVFLDVGANSECTPKNLLQFGVMGSVFSEDILEVKHPRVGLLNIGEESSKGHDTVRAAHQLIRDSGLNFVGNVEGRDVFMGAADVVVCDGFVGNVVLKFSESILAFTSHVLRNEVRRSPLRRIGAFMMKGAFSSFRSRLDYASYGGAPLLGINGVIVIGHGKSSARAIKNAILVAQRFVHYKVNQHIEEAFKGLAIVSKP